MLASKAICDDKLELKQRQCPSSLASIQNISCHEILQVFMVWIHSDFHVEFLQANGAISQRHPQWLEVLCHESCN